MKTATASRAIAPPANVTPIAIEPPPAKPKPTIPELEAKRAKQFRAALLDIHDSEASVLDTVLAIIRADGGDAVTPFESVFKELLMQITYEGLANSKPYGAIPPSELAIYLKRYQDYWETTEEVIKNCYETHRESFERMLNGKSDATRTYGEYR